VQEQLALERKVSRELTKFQAGNVLTVEFQETIRTLMNLIGAQLGKNNSYKRLLKSCHENERLQTLLDLSTLRANPELYRFACCSLIV
jgi:hypothetical protein